MRALLLATLVAVFLVSGCVGQTTVQTEAPAIEEPTTQEETVTAKTKEFYS